MSLVPVGKRKRWIAGSVVFVGIAVLMMVNGVIPRTPFNCRYVDIDITTGRVRHTRYFMCCKISERTEDTWLSKSLPLSDEPPQWRRVSTLSPGVARSSPHQYLGAIWQVRLLKAADDINSFNSDDRKEIANTVLGLWQEEESYVGASKYVCGVFNTANVQAAESTVD